MGDHQTRSFKVNWLMQKINNAADLGKMIEEETLISEFCWFFSSTRRTCMEILGILKANDQIVIEYGSIYPKKVHDAFKLREKEDLVNDKILEKI